MILTNKNKPQFTLNYSNSEEEKVIIMVHKNNYCRHSKTMLGGGRVRLIKCPYSSINSIGLMSIPVIKSQNAFY